MKTEVVLTVAESKRLIAKGVAALDYVQDKLQKGVIVVASGSTNGCLYEELTGQKIDRRAYLTGRTTPAKGAPSWQVEALHDLVLVDGKPDLSHVVGALSATRSSASRLHRGQQESHQNANNSDHHQQLH